MFVNPGDQTGEYYIIVSNLRWNSKWQDLKDFARYHPDGTCLNVDHAYIYPNGYQGWVRIKGKEDFKKAFARLNGGILEGRALLADSRNEYQPLNLPDPIVDSGSASQHHRDQRTSSISLPSPTYPGRQNNNPNMNWNNPSSGNVYTPMSPVFANGSFPSPSPQRTPTDYLNTIHNGGIVYAGNVAPNTPIIMAPQPSLYMVPITYAPVTYYHASVPPQPLPQSGTIQTEMRKVLITRLPHTATAEDLQGLLYRTISKSNSSSMRGTRSFESIDIVRNSSGQPRHAFVICDSASTARRIVQALDGREFLGRELQVRLAKEGVESGSRHHFHQDYHLGPTSGPVGPRTIGQEFDISEYRANSAKMAAESTSNRLTPPPSVSSSCSSSSMGPCVVDGTGRRRENI